MTNRLALIRPQMDPDRHGFKAVFRSLELSVPIRVHLWLLWLRLNPRCAFQFRRHNHADSDQHDQDHPVGRRRAKIEIA